MSQNPIRLSPMHAVVFQPLTVRSGSTLFTRPSETGTSEEFAGQCVCRKKVPLASLAQSHTDASLAPHFKALIQVHFHYCRLRSPLYGELVSLVGAAFEFLLCLE